MRLYANENCTGIVYPSVMASDNEAYSFSASKLVGSFGTPVQFVPESKIEQDMSLNRSGWKWFSMYVAPEENTVRGIFNNVDGEIYLIVMSQLLLAINMGLEYGETDSIVQVLSDAQDKVYDMNGRAVKALDRPGIYTINGRKVIK